ncbi:uncharacterized protein LOC135395675 [Ornithodoros turicata]|uniref:uncharacterized protein LOC135395675 n=1 Tax=Ornithodoros turicata TaxID=34597 RepID=UPI003139390C
MERMECLKRRRQGLRSAVTRTVKEATEKLGDVNLAEEDIEVLVARIKKQTENLEKVDAELEPLWSEGDVDAEQQEGFKYIDGATALLARLQFRLERNSTAISRTSERQSGSRQSENAGRMNQHGKLPKLDLVKFNGQRRDWFAFWEQFRQMVHDNQRLSTCDKFHYLRAALTGEAASAIAGLPPTERCYDDALEILKRRFGNETLQIEDHMSRLTNLQPVRAQHDVRGLRKLYDGVVSHVRALKALGVPEESFASMLYSIMLRLVPQELVVDFNKGALQAEAGTTSQSRSGQEAGDDNTSARASSQHVVKLNNFLVFLRVEVESRESSIFTREGDRKEPAGSHKDREVKTHAKRAKKPSSTSTLLHTAEEYSECFFCKAKDHKTAECQATISVEEKLRKLKEGGRCFRCTLPNHVSRRCWRKVECSKCQRRHAASVCSPRGDSSLSTDKSTSESSQFSLELTRRTKGPETILQTVVAWCKGPGGASKGKIMFDTGSQRTFVTQRTAQKLKCETVGQERLKVGVFGGRQEERTFRLLSLQGGNEYDMEALVTDVISGQNTPTPCSFIIDKMRAKDLPVQQLVCPENEEEIQVLIGTDQYWDLVTGRIVRLGSSIRAVETRIGWMVHGVSPRAGTIQHCNQTLVLRLSVDEDEGNSTLEKFWQLESIGVVPDTDDEQENPVLRRFFQSVTQNGGRCEVALPYKSTLNLGNNKGVALKRLTQLTRRLARNEELLKRYDEAIRMYSDNSMAERVVDEVDEGQSVVYYMPHQAILRESSSTTKTRVVFDCSSSCGSTKSLNQCLEAGPNLNPDVVGLLLNFRVHKIALVADVEKAFLQITVREEDRNALRYLWYETKPEAGMPLPPVESWRMTRVPFGTTASPFLLAATLRSHFKMMEEEYPETARLLSSHMYVDDLITGANDVQEAQKIAKEATAILEQAKMRLHKWATNHSDVRESLHAESGERALGDPKDMQKVLGISWLPDTDVLTFGMSDLWSLHHEGGDTKRRVLQIIARLYDPLGMLAPFTIRGRILFQLLWKRKIGWEDILPADLQTTWIRWGSELQDLPDIRVPRYYGRENDKDVVHTEIHMFCDASPTAYGAVAYTVMEDSCGTRTAAMLMAKSRLAPIKELTIPRLELMACLVGARLVSYITEKIKISPVRLHFWTDSRIALCWIRGDPQRWKQFVQNRVQEIQRLTQIDGWKYCKGKENPADLLTRGMQAKKMTESELWWSGPSWMTRSDSEWPVWNMDDDLERNELEEKKTKVLQTLTTETEDVIEMERYSSVRRLHRVVAWILRFRGNATKKSYTTGPLTAQELQRAEKCCIKLVQGKAFSEEIAAVLSNKPLPTWSTLQGSKLFMDISGVLRVAGRLHHSDLPYDQKHPVVLPKKNHYAELLIRQYHWDLLHAGVRDTLVQLREKFWIVHARQLIKSILKKCVVCQRYNVRAARQETAPLPSTRVTQSEPFAVTGLDFAGPVWIKAQRSAKEAYFVIFVCAVTRAVHLELVEAMSATAFLLAFRRFVARRGIPKVVYSDNAKAFRKSNKEIRNLWDVTHGHEIEEKIAEWRVEWRYNVPYAPWWGGFYERLVRSVKVTLKKTIGARCLKEAELNTILTEVEAILNSRPITFVYEEEGTHPLCPSAFLTGKRLTTLPNTKASDVPESSGSTLQIMWQKRAENLNTFWKRWSAEYLTELRNFHNKSKGGQLQVDDIVIVRDDRKKRQGWSTGQIIRSFPGKDGKTRAFEVRMSDRTTVLRPGDLLYKLEV